MHALNSYQEAHVAIRTLFSDAWAFGPFSEVGISWPNFKFDKPDGDYWLTFVINDGDAFVLTLGPNAIRRYLGIVSIQIFAPIEAGDAKLRNIADFIINTFKGFKHPYLFFKTGSIRDIGKDGQWYQLNVAIEFQRDSTGDNT